MRPEAPPPAPALISLDPSRWSAAVAAEFALAFPKSVFESVDRRDLSRPRPAARRDRVRTRTLGNARYSLALFEGMLHNRFADRLGSPLRDQVDGETLRGFVEHLAATNSPRSVVDHLTRLILVLRRLDLHYEAILAGMERRRIKLPPRRKRQPPFTTPQIWMAGERLIAEAKARRRQAPRGRGRAGFLRATGERFRDGLLLCFSALCIPRIANTRSMVIGRHLLSRGRVYHLSFPADEVKTKQAIDAAVPEVLVEHFELYIGTFRGLIRKDGHRDHLWASRFGGGLSLGGLHEVYKRHFRRILGVDAASHDCRRAAANMTTGDAAGPRNLAQLVLQHRSDRTLWRYVSVRSEGLGDLPSRLTGC